ncbi:M20 metallopeptidase family protein [Cellulomonas wangsupingiae]|uniref:M20 family metallopeptidase n=1 Tax=Cellulomonas wangsupingiae TaxID=2968085 RepID=A0ABY5K6L3_9CELL|nr:M20 family metallopeptidase [Cellulomonas wangsupingiae]MCC2334216.1 M20 family metallopeptidase [Cellulomonas wangsupingiae]UUI65894.1 M20 family metallopeptidase [Cellulomonas wangsupingiae]
MALDEGTLAALRDDAARELPRTTELRHALHRVPELGLDLPLTQRLVLDALADLDLEVHPGRGLSSVTAVLRGGLPGPAVLLRGDMDALPVTEEPDGDLVSGHPGVMHACGHDMHVAGLVGAARVLAARRDEIAGSVVLMFQPGEEGHGGARLMIDEGVLDAAGSRVVGAYGVHVMASTIPVGVVASRPGTLMAASDTVRVTVHGRGGHGSKPYLAADPVPVAAEIVLALQTMVTRQFDVFDPVVVTVGRIQAGTTDNVIPDLAHLDATVRTFSPATHAAVPERIARVCEHVAAAHGLTATVDYERGYPVTVNDATEVERARRVTRGLFGDDAWLDAEAPVPGAEDFSYVLEQVPGAFVFVGATPVGQDPATADYNHSPRARFADDALVTASAVLAALALDRLAQAAG